MSRRSKQRVARHPQRHAVHIFLTAPQHQLHCYTSVLASDQESYDIWKNQEGIPEEKIIRCDTKDNFWTMGEGAGPCGPCTEIFWDTKNDSLGEDRWLEIWNLVFMQHYRNDQGHLENLPIVCVDTGMGLERLASVVQSKENNFEADVFGPLFKGLHQIMTDAGIEVEPCLPP